MVFFGVLAVLCRIYRSSRKKASRCGLDMLSVSSRLRACRHRCYVMCCVSVVWCCVVPMVCVLLSLLGEVGRVGGVKGCGEIRGQRPHGATPLPMPCGAGALEVFLNVIVWSIHDACEISIPIVWLIKLYHINNKAIAEPT